MKYDVIIIGGGPAGIFCGAFLKNKKVLLVEKNKQLGKKLLISGAGQCNYTNNVGLDEFLKRYGKKGRFLKAALYNLSNNETVEFFKLNNLDSIIRDDNKIFPSTLKSSDILNVLNSCLVKNKVEIKYEEAVLKVSYDENGAMFLVKTSKETYACDNLVIAAGGNTYTNTGSTGDGYIFAKSLGHTIVKPKEALTPVFVENYQFKDLSGISFEDINITHWRNNKKIDEFNGDFLFTHTNISGPVILNNSRGIEKDDILRVNFTSYKDHEEFKTAFGNLIINSKNQTVKTALKVFNLPKRFIDKIIELSEINEKAICSELSKDKRKKLIELISNHLFKVEKLGGPNVAMVTCGGISTDEINSKTMESKIIPHLYFAGEVIDYDGDTGGFNIQAAFSTGRLAAVSINKQ